jgi:hypothetical protein
MKKVMLSMMVLTALGTSAQKDSVYVVEQKDEMTDKVYYYPSRQLLCQNADNKSQGFSISFFIDKTKKGLEVAEIKMKVIGVGSCHEKDEVIFLMEDETKIKGTMWNEFTCDGKVWCKVSDSDKEILATKKVSKIRIQNGRTFESYTHTLADGDKNYFIQLISAVKSQITKPFK